MWYEILPSFGIIVIAMALPHAVSYGANNLFLSNTYRRSLRTSELLHGYIRDRRLTNDPYKLKGLEDL